MAWWRESCRCLLKCFSNQTDHLQASASHKPTIACTLPEGRASLSHFMQLLRASELPTHLAVQCLPAEQNQKSWHRPSISPKSKDSQLVHLLRVKRHLSRIQTNLISVCVACCPSMLVLPAIHEVMKKKEQNLESWSREKTTGEHLIS